MFFCMFALAASAATEKVYATFEAPSNTNTTWNSATKTFTWSTTYYNQLRNIGLPTGDISKFKKLVIDCDIKSGEKFRILFYKGGSNKTLWVEQSGVTEFIIKDELEKLGEDYNEYILACDEICLSGSNAVAPGEVTINSMYLETYDDEGEKTFATFEAPSNTNTTWNAETKTFTWTATYYNQLKNIGLPTGDLSKYKKLVIDCDIISGEKFRILFYKGGSNLTLWVDKSGVTEFIIKDTLEAIAPNDYNEFILACDEICLSGSNAQAPGEVKINSMYLETYPENESVEIPEIEVEVAPEKPTGYIDLIKDMFHAWNGTGADATQTTDAVSPALKLGEKIGNGEIVFGAKLKNQYADLSNYSELTVVATPGLKLVFNLNHDVDVKENVSDYAEGESYVWIDTIAGADGICKIDLTQYPYAHLNNIRLPWDNNNKGTVWYLLLTEKPAEVPFEPIDVTSKVDVNAWKSEVGSTGNYTKDVAQKEQYLTNTTTNGEILYQTVTGLANGTYTVELYANASYTSGRGFASVAKNNELGRAIVYAGDVEKTIPVVHQTAVGTNNIVVLENVVVSDSTLKMGLRKDLEGSNWHTIQIKSLVQTSDKAKADAAAQDAYWTAIADSIIALNAVVGGVEKANLDKAATKADVKAALKPYYEGRTSYEALAAAINAAKTAGVDVTEAEAVLNGAETTAAKAAEAMSIVQLAVNTKAVEGASKDNPVVTNFVINGTFDSTTEPWKTTTGAQNQALADNQQGAFTGKFFENWNGNAYTGKIYQVIENIPNGIYELSICAFVNNFDASAQYVYANTDKVALTSGAPTAYIVQTNVTNNKIEVGLEQITAIANWIGIDNVKLTYFGTSSLDELVAAYNAQLTKANALLAEKMNKDVLAALQTAAAVIDTTDAKALTDATEALIKANADAEVSVAKYEAAKAVIEAGNILDETGKAAYAADTTIVELKAAYDEATLVEMTAQQATAAKTALVAATKAQTTVGAEFATAAPATWVGQTGTFGKRFERYNEKAYTGDVMTQTIDGIINGTYEVTLEATASYTSGRGFDGKTGDGLSVVFANDSTLNLNVVDRGNVGDGDFGPYTIKVVVADSTLKYGIKNVAEGANWFVVNLLSVKLVELEKTDEPGDEPGDAEEILLTSEMFHKWTTAGADAEIVDETVYPENNIGTELGAGGMLYGTSTVDYLHYADLSGYSKIIIEGTPGVQLRILMNRVEHEGALIEVNPTIGEDGTAVVDLSAYEFVHLNAIKYGWGSAAGTITKIVLVKKETTDEPGDEPGDEPSDDILLTSDMFHKWTTAGADATVVNETVYPENNIGTELGAGGMLYGTSTVDYLHYANLTGYSKMIIEGTPGVQLRVLMNRVEHEGALVEVNPTIGEDGIAEVDLTTYEFVHLNAIKYGWGSAAGTVTKIKLVKGDVVGITGVQTEKTDNIFYDMQGRRVLNPARGIYIVNGKKVFIK